MNCFVRSLWATSQIGFKFTWVIIIVVLLYFSLFTAGKHDTLIHYVYFCSLLSGTEFSPDQPVSESHDIRKMDLKNVNSWKMPVGDTWIVDIYGNLKTVHSWWLKVKATLSGKFQILWNITKLLRLIQWYQIQNIRLTNDFLQKFVWL